MAGSAAMSPRPELRGSDAYVVERAAARRLHGNRRRIAPVMLLLGVAAGLAWLSVGELPHVGRLFQWAAPIQLPRPLDKAPAQPKPVVAVGPSIPQTGVLLPVTEIAPEDATGNVLSPEAKAAAEKSALMAARGEISPEELQSMRARAARLIALADISAARLVLERAASSGDPRAIFALAETYDPHVLSAWRVRGVKSDRDRAKTLYGQALANGITEARSRMIALH